MSGDLKNVLDVTLTDKDGIEYSINTSSINTLYFIEDIYSFCMTGKLSFVDEGGLLETGNIWGWDAEKITITYGIPEESSDIIKVYKIYKLEKMLPQAGHQLERENIIEMILVSESFYKWHYHYYSRSFKDMKVTDILTHIIENMVGEEFYPQTFEVCNETIPYFYTGLRTPAENFKYLMQRITGIETGLPGYVCYENIWGFHLYSLPKYLNPSLSVIPPLSDNVIYRFASESPWLYNKVISFERNGIDNSARQQIGGGYKMGYDIKRKKNFKTYYSYTEELSKFENCLFGKSDYPIFDFDINSGQEKYEKTGEDDETFLQNIIDNNWLKQYTKQQLISIYVKGIQVRYCGGHPLGSTIEVNWPSTTKGKPNKNLDGKYFVKSIIHYFYKEYQPFYNQKLIAMKNAYDDIYVKE